MKHVFQVIGLIMVILVLITAVVFYLDSKSLLSGDFGAYIGEMRALFTRMRTITYAFFTGTGIADDAANLLSEGADKLRGLTTSTPEPTYEIIFATPEPTATPAPVSGQAPQDSLPEATEVPVSTAEIPVGE